MSTWILTSTLKGAAPTAPIGEPFVGTDEQAIAALLEAAAAYGTVPSEAAARMPDELEWEGRTGVRFPEGEHWRYVNVAQVA